MKNPFKDILYFMKGDRRAVVALGCIGVFCVGVLMVVDRPSSQPSPSMEREAMQGVESTPNERSGVVLQTFDPNTVDSLTLIGFGMKPWKVKNFLHYRAAGKVFHSAEDMGDTYGWTAEDVEMLTLYVRVGKQYEKKKKEREEREQWEQKDEKPEHPSNKFHTLTKVDVNTADTATLRRIPGVGTKISEAIVEYRERLGGFYSVEQLMEIKIVSPELLEWFMVSASSDVQKIPINRASFQALNRHPYISYEQTKALLQYVRLYGEVKDEETLLSTGIFTKEDLEKFKPYIAYE